MSAPEGELAESVARERNLIKQISRTDVTATISRARSEMRANPDGAITMLKGKLDTIRRAP